MHLGRWLYSRREVVQSASPLLVLDHHADGPLRGSCGCLPFLVMAPTSHESEPPGIVGYSEIVMGAPFPGPLRL
jgi:hypothetical protein